MPRGVNHQKTRDFEFASRPAKEGAADLLQGLHREETGPDFLGDSAYFACLDSCAPKGVCERGLPAVHVPEYYYDWLPQPCPCFRHGSFRPLSAPTRSLAEECRVLLRKALCRI